MRRFVIAAMVLGASAAPARAQSGLLQSCKSQVPSQVAGMPDVVDQFHQMCAQVVNSFAVLQPGIGIAFSGGNPVLGSGSTIGTRLGLMPRVTVSLRGNLALAEMPQLFEKYSAAFGEGETLKPMPRAGIPLGSVQADAAVGLFNGLAFGAGAVDLLASVSLVPRVNDIGLSESIMNYGAGARIGILKQGLLMPGVSVSGMYRRMGTIGFGDIDTHPGAISGDLDNLSLRAVASKGLLMLDLALGAGYDRYSSDVDLSWKVSCGTNDCLSANGGDPLLLQSKIDGKLTTSAWNVFANAGMSLLLVNIVGEIGYQKASDGLSVSELQKAGFSSGQKLTGEALKGGNFFGSIGVRLTI